jgi:hypothetical protein
MQTTHNKIEACLPVLVLLVTALLFALLQGVSTTPNFGQVYAIATDIFAQQAGPENHWLEQSFLLPSLAHLLGVNSSPEIYFVFLLAVLVLVLGLLALLLQWAFGSRLALLAIAALAASGALISAGFWIGYADGLSLLYGTALYVLLSNSERIRGIRSLLFILSLLAAWSHFTQAAVLLLVNGLLLFRGGGRPRLLITTALFGLIVGKILLLTFFQKHGFSGLTRLEYFARYDVLVGMMEIVENRAVYLFSLFRFGWPILLIALWVSTRADRLRLSAALLVLVLFSVVGTDHSRIASIIAWPILLHSTVLCFRSSRGTASPLLFTVLVLLSLIAPAYHVWGTTVYQGPLNDQAYRFSQKLFDRLEMSARVRDLEPVQPGLKYDFDDARSLAFLGWSAAEAEHRWSLGRSAVIKFNVSDPNEFAGELSMRVHGFGDQSIIVRLNRQLVSRLEIGDADRELSISFPPEILTAGEANQIEFRFSSPASPGPDDPRQLALLIKWLMFAGRQD